MLKFRGIGVFLKKPSRDPVGTQSGPSRAPILAFLGTAFGQSGRQFSNFLHHVWTCREAAKSPKNAQKHCKNAVFCAFGCLPTLVPDWIPTGSRLDPDWIPTGQKRCPKMQKLMPDWVPTGSRRDPDWIHRSARTHSRTYFSLPRPTLAPIFLFRAPAVHQYPPPSCTKTAKAVLSQTGVLQGLWYKNKELVRWGYTKCYKPTYVTSYNIWGAPHCIMMYIMDIVSITNSTVHL